MGYYIERDCRNDSAFRWRNDDDGQIIAIFQKGLNTIATDSLHMESTTFNNVSEVLSRIVKADGRCGGLQNYTGQSVDIVIYRRDQPDTAEEEDN